MAWVSGFSWFPLFAEYLMKSTAVLTMGLILMVLFRKRPASLRHFVLSVSLAGLLLLPVLPYLGGGWETSFLPAGAGARSVFPAARAPAKAEDNGQGSNGSNGVLLPPSASSIARDSNSKEHLLFGASGFLLKSALPLFWSAGLIFLLLRLAAGLFGAFRLTREGETVRDPGWRVLLERFLTAIKLHRKVCLKSHCDIRIPLTCGLIRPVVLIPDGYQAWTEEQRSSTLIHELSHIKRADFLIMVLVRLSLALFWFNPLSWVVFRRLKDEQEEACDELVLKTGLKPSTYAASLLFFKSAAGSRLGHFAALLGLFGLGRSAFNERLAAILEQKWAFQEVKMKTKILLFSAVILGVAFIGLARPSSSVTEKAGAAVVSPSAVGAPISEEMSVPEGQVAQATEQSQDESVAKEKKDKEKKPQEPVQAQEEKKPKAVEKPAVVVTVKEGEKHRHAVTIKEGDTVKTITADEPVIIREGAEGKVILITPRGQEVTVLQGKPAHLEIKADKLEIIEEGKIGKVGKDGTTVYVVVEPDIDLGRAVDLALEETPVTVNVAEPLTAHVTLEPDVKVDTYVTPHLTLVSEDRENEIREKLRDIREKLKKVEEKKLELREVDEALADLEKELEQMSQETSSVEVRHTGKPKVFTVVKERSDEDAAAETEPEHSIAVVAKEKGSFLLICQEKAGEKGREAYDKIVARVKKELPEGYTLEPKLEEESGLITLKVDGPFGKGAPHDLVQKLADCIRDETKEKQE